MAKKIKKAFNPDDFDIDVKVEDVVKDFPQLSQNDYTQVSLNLELVKLNYEVVSPEYKDLEFKNIEEYFPMDVDYIV